MTSDSEDLNDSANLSIDEIKMKNLKTDAANCRRQNNLMTMRRLTCCKHGRTKLSVVTPTQTCLPLFVVSDLLTVFCRSFWMQPILHLRMA
jgi:hypothetical protein